MFVKELQLYLSYLKEQIDNERQQSPKLIKGWGEFGKNLFLGIDYYKDLVGKAGIQFHEKIKKELLKAEQEVQEQLSRLDTLAVSGK